MPNKVPHNYTVASPHATVAQAVLRLILVTYNNVTSAHFCSLLSLDNQHIYCAALPKILHFPVQS